MKKKQMQEKEHSLEKSIKEIETTEEDIKLLVLQESKKKKKKKKKRGGGGNGRSSVEVKSKMGC